jgi:D-tyrosyl-tRNA(Tyr) deacylase
MKFVIQRVTKGCVRVEGQIVGQIGKGLMILVGLTEGDTEEYIDHVVDKFLNIKLFDDEKGARWKESVKSLGLDLLLVSQFTLYNTLKGNKPDFHFAMEGNKANELFDKIVKRAKEKYDEKKVQTGKFGEHMFIEMECDGPVTINWEYPTQKLIDNINNNNVKKGKDNNENKNKEKKEGKSKNKKDKNQKKEDNKDELKKEEIKEENKKEEDQK